MRVKRSSAGEAQLDPAALEKLRAGFRGELLVAGQPAYEEARRVFNAAIDRRPAIVARCRSAADVVAAVQFAREHDLLVSTRSGGADIAGTSMVDGGFVVDLSRMTAVHVSPAKKTVRVEAGATWGVVDRETALFGLATTGGTVPKVGVAGFTLGGGIGWLARRHGLACDNLLSVDVVTADGKLTTASATENEELFWGLRGGGGNFGVVTSFELQVHDVRPMFGGMLVYPMKQGREVLERYRDVTRAAPDRLALYATTIVHPEAGPVVAVAGCYDGNAVEGQAALEPLRALRPMVDAFRPLPYLELQGMLDAAAPAGLHHAWKSCFARTLTDKMIGVLLDQFAQVPSPRCQILVEHLGGAVGRVGRDATAFSHRDAQYTVLIMGVATDGGGAQAAARWAKQTWDVLRPAASEGVYVNYLSHDDDALRVRAAYDATTLQRLTALKKKVDPTNFFRHNHNVKPSDDASANGATASLGDAQLRQQLEALLARFDALEERVMELEFENSLTDKPKKKAQ